MEKRGRWLGAKCRQKPSALWGVYRRGFLEEAFRLWDLVVCLPCSLRPASNAFDTPLASVTLFLRLLSSASKLRGLLSVGIKSGLVLFHLLGCLKRKQFTAR
jgi:hypothetical protein